MSSTILEVVKACDNFIQPGQPTTHPRATENSYAFRVNGCSATLGHILRETVEKIQWSGWWTIDHTERIVTLATAATATAAVRSRIVAETLAATRERSVISMLDQWREEPFPVYGPDGNVVLEVERCASALFGIVTYGVQLVCYVRDEGTSCLRVWVATRSPQKQTYPGMLDCTAAGGLVAGMTPIEALVCEAREEASLSEDMVRGGVKSMGHLSYFHVRGRSAGGEVGLLQPEVEYTYQLELDAGVVPTPRDSEVQGFSLWTVEEVLVALRAGRFKPNSAVVIVQFLMHHDVITPENEPAYAEICSHLHRKLDLPVLIQPYQ
ncbi:thiamine pyrophosphokinase-related protein [Aspergillus homomorphus CBS 101889]|uniref:Thiamine pyrophosphokinase-related protein n=1 Tax=Aspergillus homomorphus (strain CBS 101889) TaxID=1450537 RepID=A0A395HKN7_ASPHC|nr:thiamine pyrophosphokinase-related protein [Aspergillus homomorphus CBS 101889]RAL06834.1 thiamine pyrophosphokinase-related protein [Aspergillus homomorphus CBS 101889]